MFFTCSCLGLGLLGRRPDRGIGILQLSITHLTNTYKMEEFFQGGGSRHHGHCFSMVPEGAPCNFFIHCRAVARGGFVEVSHDPFHRPTSLDSFIRELAFPFLLANPPEKNLPFLLVLALQFHPFLSSGNMCQIEHTRNPRHF